MAKTEESLKNEGGDQRALEEKVVEVRRTTKVVKGGRILRFSVIVVIGDKMGNFGVGLGKAREVQQAILKGIYEARKNMQHIRLNKNLTVQHPIVASHGASKVVIQPASEGTGIIAGGAMRAIFEVAGVQNVLAKCIGSTNPSNVVRATIKGLKAISAPRYIAEKRGKTLQEITS